MKRPSLLLIGGLIALVAFVAFSALFTVHQTQQALILQFGNPIRVEREPGLKAKVPFVQNVEFYEKRILDLDPPSRKSCSRIRSASTSMPSPATASSIRWSSRSVRSPSTTSSRSSARG